MSIRNLFKYVRTKDENLNKALLSAKDQFDVITRAVNTGTDPAAHILVGPKHTGSGLTAGHFLKAASPTTFGFAAHGLGPGDVGAAAASHPHAATDITSATLDGDRLPALNVAKKGGVPATGTPSGKFLKDNDTWDTPSGTGVPSSRLVSTTSPLAGGGALTGDRTLSLGGLSSIGAADRRVKVNHAGTGWEYQSDVVVDIRDFGASPSASAETNNAAIQAALDAAPEGGKVVAPSGEHSFLGGLLVPNGVRFSGVSEGNGSILKMKPGTTPAFAIAAKTVQEYFYLENLMINGNNGGGATFSEGVLKVQSAFNNCRVRDLVIWNYSGAPGIVINPGVSTDSLGAALFENIWLLPDSNSKGIEIKSIFGTNERIIRGFNFHHIMIELTRTEPAIYIESSQDNYIQGLAFDDLWVINPAAYSVVPIQLNGIWRSSFNDVKIAAWSAKNITLSNATNKHCYDNVFINLSGFGNTPIMIEDAMTGYTSANHVSIYAQANSGESNAVFGNRALLRAYLSANQDDLTSGAWTTVNLDTESYDVGNNFNTTLYKFVVPTTGYYEIIGQIMWSGALVADKRYNVGVFKGATQILNGCQHASHTSSLVVKCRDILYLTAADELYLKAYNDSGVGSCDVISGQYNTTFLSVRLITT